MTLTAVLEGVTSLVDMWKKKKEAKTLHMVVRDSISLRTMCGYRLTTPEQIAEVTPDQPKENITCRICRRLHENQHI